VFADKKSEKDANRKQLSPCLDYTRIGDTLAVTALDRLGRLLSTPVSAVRGWSVPVHINVR
jgi:DNA invertase Pin-like site-specific DNA recombinase